MAKAKLKTTENDNDVAAFISSVHPDERRLDAQELRLMFEKITRKPAKMWGSAIIGFGNRNLKYDSGRELDWLEVGFSPRKANLSLYLTCSLTDLGTELAELGKHKIGANCLYITRLADIDRKVLEKMIRKAYKLQKEQA